nr:hypothetical protein B0A51_15511 [Rachicladosporium sp. CCFEE 5018]
MASCYHGVDNEEISRLTAELLSLSERPSLSDTVAYKYEPLEEGHIRLITLLPGRAHDQIRLKLQHVDFANPPPYCALSYVWGTPEPRCNVWIGDQTFEIGPNLYAALSQIRSKNAALIIWIDAVAINQSDNREKSKQIPQMATLYRRAERVIAWLGETEESAAVAFAFLDLWARWDRHGVELQRELTAELKFVIFPKYSITVIGECLRRFCRRPFFRRAWTWQEICTPADRPAIFCCGEDVILIDTVRDAFYSMLATLTRSEQGDLLGVAGEVMWTAIAHQQQPGDTISFTSTVAHMDRREASNVLDHIYAYRGMFSAPEGSYPDPDYDLPVHEVFTSYTRASIRLEKSLHIISRIRPGEAYWNIPSWAVKPPPLTSHWSYVGSEFESAR